MSKLVFALISVSALISMTVMALSSPQEGWNSGEKYPLAIVIDDFGYNGDGTEEMLALDIPFTAAIMPFSEFSAEDAAAAADAGKEVIIHMPMESLTGNPEWVGPKAVKASMSDDEIKSLVREAIEIVPQAIGLNNHMGSKIMENDRALRAVMETVRDNGLIFIDSKTTLLGNAEEIAESLGVPYLRRDVFLDSTKSIETVRQNLMLAAELAVKNGYALAIGHVGPEGGRITAKAIEELAPLLNEMGIEFVTVTQLYDYLEANSDQSLGARLHGFLLFGRLRPHQGQNIPKLQRV